MRRRDHEVHPSTHSYLQRRRVPVDTKEREDTVKKLFHSLNMITHIQTNILHPYNHISHIRLAESHHRTPSTHSYVPRRRVPEDTNEIEDTVKKLFHSLNMITHIQINTLHPYNHISHIRLVESHHRAPSHTKVMRRKALGRHK